MLSNDRTSHDHDQAHQYDCPGPEGLVETGTTGPVLLVGLGDICVSPLSPGVLPGEVGSKVLLAMAFIKQVLARLFVRVMTGKTTVALAGSGSAGSLLQAPGEFQLQGRSRCAVVLVTREHTRDLSSCCLFRINSSAARCMLTYTFRRLS